MLNLNTVRARIDSAGRTVYDVLDSLGRRQATYSSFAPAVRYAGRICRYGWPLDLAGHGRDGSECAGEHDRYAAAVGELSALSA